MIIRLLFIAFTLMTGCITIQPIVPKFKIALWCDHAPVWVESPERRHVKIEANCPDIRIVLVEINAPNGESATCLILANADEDLHTFEGTGMFPEGFDNQELTVSIRYYFAHTEFIYQTKCKVLHTE